MFARSLKFVFVAAAAFLLAAAVIGSSPMAAYGQCGHGGGYSGFGHGGYGYSGYGHGFYGHGGYGHSLYGHSGFGHYGGLSNHHDTPHYGFYYWPWDGPYGYGNLGYGSYYGLYGLGGYGQPCTAFYPPASDASGSVVRGSPSGVAPRPDYLSAAKKAFRAGDYAQAARLANHAVVESPRNGKLFLFVSQALFATGDYQGATAALYQATSLLEPKDWGYLVQNFRDYYGTGDYPRQMERLTRFIEENPDAAYAWTLRGYHYGFFGDKESAQRDLARAVELEKRDKLASQLLELFGGPAPTSASPGTPAPGPKDATEPRHGGHGHRH